MTTPENQLNLRSRHPDYQEFLDINEGESARVRRHHMCYLDQRYGSAALQTLDIFPSSTKNAPILVFIHGGYWRALDKESYSFVAEPFVKNDFTVCIVNYRLIPTVDMETLLLDIRDALVWIQREAPQYNGNPNQIILSGHSAGGHLALAAYLMNESLRSDIRAICSISGIFDLAPIKNSYLNEVLNLTKGDVKSFSVSNKDQKVLNCPVLLSVGSDETDFFIEQSRKLYLENGSKAPLEFHEYKQLNHYQIVHELGRENSHLVNFIMNVTKTKKK